MKFKTSRLIRVIGFVMTALVGVHFVTAANAEVTEKDFQVIARALGFMTNGPKGTVDIAIVHAPEVPASMAEAQAAQTLLGEGLQAGALTLRPVMVPASDLGKLTGVGAIFVTPGMDGQQDAIFAASQTSGTIIISTDRACVEAGKCTMFVATAAKVEILVNKAAAAAANVSFDSAFKMMIKEI